MSILERYEAALKDKDEAAMNELLHDDFKFTMHKSGNTLGCLLYTSPSPRDKRQSRMPSSA